MRLSATICWAFPAQHEPDELLVARRQRIGPAPDSDRDKRVAHRVAAVEKALRARDDERAAGFAAIGSTFTSDPSPLITRLKVKPSRAGRSVTPSTISWSCVLRAPSARCRHGGLD